MSGCRDQLLVAVSVSAVVMVSGCKIETPLAVHRMWADYNTLGALAAYCETTSRVPMDSARVRELRWEYNMGPDKAGDLILVPVAKTPPVVTSNAPVPASTSGSSSLPPEPGKMKPPPAPAASTGPVATQPPDPGRTALARDAWRFIH